MESSIKQVNKIKKKESWWKGKDWEFYFNKNLVIKWLIKDSKNFRDKFLISH